MDLSQLTAEEQIALVALLGWGIEPGTRVLGVQQIATEAGEL